MAVKVPQESTVLLIDDEREVLDSMRFFLEHTFPGIRILTATESQAGLDLLWKGGVDIVLADYKMPGKNGLDLLKEAALRRPEVPRILFTAYPDMEVAIQALNEARIRWFMLKPLEPIMVGGIVANILAEGDGKTSPQA